MNRKLIVSVVASMVLASSLVAASCKGENSQKGCGGEKQNCSMMKNKSGGKKGGSFFYMVERLNLSDAQKTQLEEIKKEKMQMRQKAKAQTVEKINAILDEKQKEEFKNMMDSKENRKNKMKKGNCDDKNCNGRG